MMMRRYPDQQSILEAILNSVDSGKTIRSIDVNQRDASLYKEAATNFGGYYSAVEAAAAIRREELPEFRLEKKKRSVSEQVKQRWEKGKSIHPDQMVRENWRLYWEAVVAYGSYESMLEQIGYDVAEVLSRRLWPKTQVGMALRRLHDSGEDLSATNMQKAHKALHTAARRAYETYEKALTENGIPYEQIRRTRRVTPEMVIEEMIALARQGRDMRVARIDHGPDTQHLKTNMIDHFGSYRKCIARIYDILVQRGETSLARKFDFRAMQLRTKAERMARRKRKEVSDVATISTNARYARDTLTAVVGKQLSQEDMNAIFRHSPVVGGRDVRTYIQTQTCWALPSRLEKILGCSDDTIKRHRIFRALDAVICVKRGQAREYYIDTRQIHMLTGRTRDIDASAINPDRIYSIVDVSKMLQKSRKWVSEQFGTPKDRRIKKIPGYVARSLAMKILKDESKYSLSEAGRAVGISEKRVRDFVKDKKVVPISDRPLLLDEPAIQKLEDLVAHEKALVKSWTESINADERYGYHQLIMLGLPLSSIYHARRDGRINATEEDGAARFSGAELLSFIKRYNTAFVNKFTRGMPLKYATLYTPEEIVRLTRYQVNTAREMVQELLARKKVIVLHAGQLRHYLVEKDILDEHLYGKRSEQAAEPEPETPEKEFTIDPLVLQYVQLRDSRKTVERELDLSTAAVIAVTDHMKRGTYSHITKNKTLTAEQFLSFAAGLEEDRALKQLAGQLVRKYERLIAGEARKYFGANPQDLVQEGRMAFIDALDNYDPARGSGFVFYTRRAIRSRMTRFARNTEEDIRTPQYMFHAAKVVRRARGELSTESSEEISDKTGLTVGTVERVQKGRVKTKPLSAPMTSEDDRTLEDILPGSQADPEQIHLDSEKREEIKHLISMLKANEREVIMKRFYEGKTLEQVGEEMGVTRENVRQVQVKALAKLQKKFGGKKRHDFE